MIKTFRYKRVILQAETKEDVLNELIYTYPKNKIIINQITEIKNYAKLYKSENRTSCCKTK